MTLQQARNILGVSGNASKKEVKKAYRKRARETHPDIGGNKNDFVKVKQAYDILKDPTGGRKAAGNWNNERRNYSYQNVRTMYEEFMNDFAKARERRGFNWEDRFGEDFTDWNADYDDMEDRVMFLSLTDMVNGVVHPEFVVPSGVKDGEKITTSKGVMRIHHEGSGKNSRWRIINDHDLLYTCPDLTLMDFLLGTTVHIDSIHKKIWKPIFGVYEGKHEQIKLTVPENSLPNVRYKIAGHGITISKDPWNTNVDRGDLYVDLVPKKADDDTIERLKNNLQT